MVQRVVLLDAVGTLIRPVPPVGEAYWRAGSVHGSRLDRPEVEARFRAALARHHAAWSTLQELPDARADSEASLRPDLPSALAGPVPAEGTSALGATESATRTERGRCNEALERHRWRAVVAEVFSDVELIEPLFLALWDYFAQAANWALFPDVADTCRRLRSLPIRLGIASNFDGRLRAVCRGLPPLDQLQPLFCSSEVGFRKPDPRFYERVAAACGVTGREILLVGDDPISDGTAARDAGWNALVLRRQTRPHAQPGMLHDLRALPEFLANMP